MLKAIKQVCLAYLSRYQRWYAVLTLMVYIGILFMLMKALHDFPASSFDKSAMPRPGPQLTMVSNSVPGTFVRPTRSLRWEVNLQVPLRLLKPLDFPNLVSLEIAGASQRMAI